MFEEFVFEDCVFPIVAVLLCDNFSLCLIFLFEGFHQTEAQASTILDENNARRKEASGGRRSRRRLCI